MTKIITFYFMKIYASLFFFLQINVDNNFYANELFFLSYKYFEFKNKINKIR